MSKKQVAYRGYLLLESCVAFILVTVLIVEFVPLIVSVKQLQQASQQRLEVARYFSELAGEYRVYQAINFQEKSSNRTEMTASGEYSKAGVTQLTIDLEDEQYEITWLGGWSDVAKK